MGLVEPASTNAGASGLFKFPSVDEKLRSHSGIGPGFDYLRLALALVILVGHVVGIVHGEGEQRAIGLIAGANAGQTSAEMLSWWAAWAHWRHAFQGLLVPMFFALSGFLVTASALRLKSVRAFLIFRGLRILPALTVEVTLSALILGPIFTNLPLAEYFSSYGFFRYFGNIFGFVTFFLPGVFENNPWPKIVNANLWTLPGEFYCYLILAICMSIRLAYNKFQYTIFFAILTTLYACLLAADLGIILNLHVAPEFRGSVDIAYYFFVGCFFYHWRTSIPASVILAAVSGLLSLLLMKQILAGEYVFLSKICVPFFVAYLTVSLGVAQVPSFQIIKKGDYSYGIYLYGFPIAQALIATIPTLRGHIFIMLFSAISLTIFFAILSWHLFERPTLQLKARFGSMSRPV